MKTTTHNSLLVRDREFYRTFIRLCVALMLEQAVILSVNLADNVMLGTYSEAALSGVAAVNQIQFVYQQIVYSIGNAVVVLGSQYWGQRRTREIRMISSIGIYAELLIAAVLFLCASLFTSGMVSAFTNNPVYIGEGSRYLLIIRFTYPFFALTAVLLSTLRVVEIVNIALKVSVISLVINVSINYLLIPGRLGLPELGAAGAAVGTLTARIVEFLVVLLYVLRDQKLGLRPSDLLHAGKERLLRADFVRILLPILGAGILWGVSNALQTVILGHMNDSAIAAQSISNTVFLLLKVTAVGAASAASVMIGKSIGQGNLELTRAYARTLQVIFIGIGIVLAVAMILIRVPLLQLYSREISEETCRLANAYMLIQAAVLLFMSYQMPVNAGIIRGGGDVRFVLYLDTFVICTFIPLSALCAFVFKWPPVAVILVMNADQFLKCIPAYLRVRGDRWMKKLTR